MALSETKLEDLREDARHEAEAEASEYEHYEFHFGEWAKYADECRLCRRSLDEEADDAAEAAWERRATEA